MPHILLVEDDKRLSRLIATGLLEQDMDISFAYDGEKAYELASTEYFDLIITDIIVPIKNGLEFCKEIKALKPNIPVIMLTALGTTDDKLTGFDSGADDYLTKPFEMRELIARVKVLLKRFLPENRLTSSILKYDGLEMDLKLKTIHRDGIIIKLTPKEFNLMQFLLENPERVLSRAEIAENVWETRFDTGTNFIDVYINYIRKKIDKDFETKLIHTKLGMGFILKKGYEDHL
ncbi:response regulator transcription factor [Chryseobacterium sp. JUb7]|uniref:response regulator transcription factor n=1 Tax=Chryseobacterium sp. JUb7 TaxID=2940599 RepID=UPI002167AACC|nr:response regulator transcription factor [Chryseobacterium sp. JUb7]MCS3531519.1 DNA-binding response OmpR family regulator [Chryseobacterium sp. JUb7]